MRKISAEEKLLRTIVKNEMDDKTRPLKQEIPVCQGCSLTVDIMDPAVRVDFRDIEVRGKNLVVAEPNCPKCGVRITAEVNAIH